jgi:hypothetical protein
VITTDSASTLSGRIAGGIFAGAIFGLVVQVFCLAGPPEDRRILLVGPAIGATLVAIVAVLFGRLRLRGWLKTILASLVAGAALGGFGGVLVFPIIMTVIEYDRVYHEKIYAVYANVGVIFGIPLGALIGLAMGSIIIIKDRITRERG